MAGVSQPPQLAAVQARARALHDGGNAPAARQLLSQALEAAQPAYGKDHPEVLGTVHLLAQWHREGDDPAAARRILEEALVDGQHRWGEADPLILALCFELGTVAEELGNRHEARRNFGRVATLGPAVLGDDNWQVRAARDYLGDAPSNGSGAAPQPPVPVSAPHATTPFSAPPAPVSAPHAGSPFSAPPAQSPPVSAPHAGSPFSAPPAQSAPVSSFPAPPQPQAGGLFSTAAGAPTAPANQVEAAAASPWAPAVEPTPAYVEQPTATYPAYSARSVQQPEPYPVVLPTPIPTPAPAPAAGPEPARGRGSAVAATVAAAAAVIAAIVVVVAVVLDNNEPPGGTADQSDTEPVIAGEPPTDVTLLDEGTAITITWKDPSGGTVPFVVAGARANQQTTPMRTLGAGETSYKVNALNPRLDYCFSVLAVYSTSEFAPSDLVCTKRDGTGATPR